MHPVEPHAFAEALFQLALDPDARYLMGEAARRYAEEHLRKFNTSMRSIGTIVTASGVCVGMVMSPFGLW